MELNESQELISRQQGLLIERCANGTYRWECLAGHGEDCESEEAAYAEFFEHMK